MGIESFLDGRVILHPGDCLATLRGLPDDHFDSVVTDPPYALVSIAKRFGKPGAAPASGVYGRAAAGFMGKAWDTGQTAFAVEFWTEVFRVLKPGGHVVAFGGTRSYHRLACAIEDAGFEIRDQRAWVDGTGFPKSHDVSKGIDKAAGAERTVSMGVKPGHEGFANRGNMSSVASLAKGTLGGDGGFSRPWMEDPKKVEAYHHKMAPATAAALAKSTSPTSFSPRPPSPPMCCDGGRGPSISTRRGWSRRSPIKPRWRASLVLIRAIRMARLRCR